jgi:DUF1680 family protein
MGHMTGHYLSAASRMAAATSDDSLKTKTTYVVTELATCQTALGENGYLAAFPSTVFDWLEGTSTSTGDWPGSRQRRLRRSSAPTAVANRRTNSAQ